MNTSQINNILKNNSVTQQCFLGTFPSDKLPISTQRPLCFVANTDPSTAKGSHWVAVYVNNKDRAEFYDSYGRGPKGIFLKHLENYKAFRYNQKQLQSFGSSVCGQHCILFLHLRCIGEKMATVLARFVKDTVVNDAAVCLAVNQTFSVSHSLVDDGLIQICDKM